MEENISNENDEIEKVTRMQSFEVSLPETNPPPKKFPLKTILIVSGLIALSIIIILIIIFAIKGNSDSNDKDICPNGYFIPSDDSSQTNCLKCSIEHCSKCSGNTTIDICDSCSPSFFTVYENETIKACEPLCKIGENEICLTCDEKTNKCLKCKPPYILMDEKCELSSFIAIFVTKRENEAIRLINPTYSNNIIGLKVEDEDVKPSGTYKFPSPGNHKVYLIVDISSHTSLYQMFNMNYEMI